VTDPFDATSAPDAGTDNGAGEGPLGADTAADATLSVEALLDDLDRVTAERDAFLDDSRRIAADFANFRRQVEKRNVELVEHANAGFVEKLLPTLDACDAAIAHGAADVAPVLAALLGTLEKEGLERVHPEGDAFDPNLHEAVIHEEGDTDAPVVDTVLRTGYAWKGRVIRPAMVKVRG
jgi:molecular chaperone GrpE